MQVTVFKTPAPRHFRPRITVAVALVEQRLLGHFDSSRFFQGEGRSFFHALPVYADGERPSAGVGYNLLEAVQGPSHIGIG